METTCDMCGSRNPIEAANCVACGSALSPEFRGIVTVSLPKKIGAFLLGAVATGLLAAESPLAVAVILGGAIAVMATVRSANKRIDSARSFILRASSRGIIDQGIAERLLAHRRWETGESGPSTQTRLEDILPPPPSKTNSSLPMEERIVVEPRPYVSRHTETEATASRQQPEPVQPVRPILPPLPSTQPEGAPTDPERRSTPIAEQDWALALGRLWETLRSDLAVHGLAYLGVLFVFVGVVGFVMFAFSGVGSAFRPIAEITIPVALFGSARFLRGSSAPFVARSMELLGGLLTPVVLFAAFADGAPFPPDQRDEALIITLTLVSLVLAVGYGWLSVRNPNTSLRYLVAPLLWTAVGVVGLAFERGPSAAQFAAITVAVAATTSWVRRFGEHPIGSAAASVALPGAFISTGFALIFAATSNWPPIPILVAAFSLLIVIELRRSTLPLPWLWQMVAGLTAAVSIAQSWPPAAVASVTALLALTGIEWWHHRREPEEATFAGLGVHTMAVLISTQDPAWLFISAAGGFAWMQYRRIQPISERLTPIMEWGGAILPLAAVVGLRDWAGIDTAWSLVTGFIIVAALLVRMLRPSDFYQMVWIAGAAVVLLVGSVVDSPHVVVSLSMTAGAALAFVASARGPGLGIWAAAAATTFAISDFVTAVGIDSNWAPVAVAIAGLSAVVWSSLTERGWTGHIGTVGHLAGIAAVFWVGPAWWMVAVLGAFIVGLLWSLVLEEDSPAGTPALGLISRVLSTERRYMASAFGLVASLTIPIWLNTAADAARIGDGSDALHGLIISCWALLAGVGARLLSTRIHLGGVIAWSAFALSGIGAVAAIGSVGPEMITLGLLPTTVIALGPKLRRTAMTWTAWATLGLLAISVANHSNVAPSELHRIGFVWGSVVLIGALSIRRWLSNNDRADVFLSRVDVLPPIALGALAIIIGTGLEFYSSPNWLWVVAAGLVAGVSAVLASTGAISIAAWGLLTAGLWIRAEELGWLNDERMWPTTIWVGLLCTVAAGLMRFSTGSVWWQRWDVPPFGVAHATAAVALVISPALGDIPITWAGFGILSAGVAITLRRWPWAIGAAALFVGASVAQGGGWPTFTLLSLSAVTASLTIVSNPKFSFQLHTSSALFALSAWGSAVMWREWWPDPAVAASAVGAGLVAIGVAVVVRRWTLAVRLASPWAAAAFLIEGVAVANITTADRLLAGRSLAIGLALWAVAIGLAAAPLGIDRLRNATIIPALGSGLALSYSEQTSVGTTALTAATAGALLALGGFWLKSKQGSVWANPVLIGSAAADVVAVVAGATLLPETSALAIVLAAIGLKLLVAAVLLPSPIAGVGSIWSFAGAWLLFATTAADGDPQWYAVPVGIALAVSSDLGRWHIRRTGERLVDLAVADGLAVTLIVGPSVVQTFRFSTAYGLLVMVLGLLIIGWGAATRVRRRLLLGAGAVAAGMSLIVILPLAKVIPQFRGPALWATVIILGVGLIGAAVGLERGRSTVRQTMKRLNELTTGWE